MPHILLTGTIHQAGMDVLAARPDVTVEPIEDSADADFLGRLPAADALIIRTAVVPAAAVEAAERLRVVSRHGGHIEVRSRPGEGTCFAVDLPREFPAENSLETGEEQ